MDEKTAKLFNLIKRHKWVLPLGFALLLLLSAASIALPFLRGFETMPRSSVFNVGMDIVGIAVCSVLFFGCISGKDSGEITTYLFVGLLYANAAQLFLDECTWLLDGVANLRVLNLFANTLYFLNGIVLVYQFWRYVRETLGLESKFAKVSTNLLNLIMFPCILLCFVNFFYPLYFSVDETGTYARTGGWFYLYYLFVVSTMVVVVVSLFLSKSNRRQKNVVISFITLPIANAVVTAFTYGISTQYIAMLISIVLVYAVLFSDKSKSLASTQNELHTATQIQAAMLPNIYPAFPERDEFDIYATMDPAKEVGGDFYDFFLVDDDHLCMVMADVSGKGVPAALFMMASKIILANNAMMGKSPAQILSDTNNAICSNNREEMFVTVWLGILEISTGKLMAANAGHEYPALKSANGNFELYKDKHGFVVGGMAGAKYRDYEIQLEKGSKLFLYTDGVPEATDANNQLFGTDRMIEALNKDSQAAPNGILKNVRASVDEFVDKAEQFDDLTMLCMEYRGKQEN